MLYFPTGLRVFSVFWGLRGDMGPRPGPGPTCVEPTGTH